MTSLVAANENDMSYSNELEQILRCAVCLDMMKDPKILPCQHTFCASPCLEGLIDSARILRCPECREQYLAPPGGVRQLPSNRVILNLLELSAASEGRDDTHSHGDAKRRCISCRKDEVELQLCLHCNRQTCLACKVAHSRQLKLDVGLFVGRIRSHLPNVSDQIAAVDGTAAAVRSNVEQLKAEVESVFERLVSWMRRRERTILDELKAFDEGQVRKLRLKRGDYEATLTRASGFCDTLDRLLSSSMETSDAELVSLRRQCTQQLKCLDQIERGSEETRPCSLQFLRSKSLHLVESCDIGTLVPMGANLSSLDVDTATAGDRAENLHSHLDSSVETSRLVVTGGTENRRSNRDFHNNALGVNLLQWTTQAFQQSERTIASPFESVRHAFAEYMRAVRPFVSPAITEPLAEYPQGNGGSPLLTSIQSRGNRVGSDVSYNTQDFISALHDGMVASNAAASIRLLSGPEAGRQFSNDVVVPAGSADNIEMDVGGTELDERTSTFGRMDEPSEGGRDLENYSFDDTSVPQNRTLIDYQRKTLPAFKIGSRGTETGTFTWPRGVAASPVNDTIVVADSSNQRVQVFDRQGRYVHAFGSYGQGDGQFDTPTGVAATQSGYIVVSDRYNNRLLVFDSYGDFIRKFGDEGAEAGQLMQPWGLACDALDYVYVCDKGNHRIQVFQLSGTFVRTFGRCGQGDGEFNSPYYVCISQDNKVIVSDSGNNRVQVFTTLGEHLATFGVEGSAAGQLRRPRGVAVDSQGYVIVADSGNNRIQVFRQDGTLHWVFGSWGYGNGNMKGTEGLALNSCGQIVVVDRDNHRLQVF